MRNKLLVVTLLAMLAGCAGIKIVKVTDDSTEGLRFYRPEPYLIVTSSSTTIQWLPNFKQEYAVQVRSGWFGSIEPKIALDNGWNLTSLGGTITSNGSGAVTSITSLLTTVAPLVGLKGFKATENESGKGYEENVRAANKLQPGIYRFDFDANGRITNLKPVLPE